MSERVMFKSDEDFLTNTKESEIRKTCIKVI